MTALTALTTAFSVTLCSIFLLRPLAERLGLVDMPDHRKQHQGQIPLIGGVAMFLGITSASVIFMPYTPLHTFWLMASLIITALGVADDAKGLSVKLRLRVQVLVTVALSISSGLYLENLGSILGFGDLHLSYFGYIITILAVLGAINAFNMIDGIDGLAGCTALVSFSGLAILFSNHADHYGLQLAIIFLSVLLPYLAMNLTFPPFRQKIFMGDAGAMLIGLAVVWLLMHGTQSNAPSFRPVTALWLIAVPLMDMAAIMLRRVQRGDSPFMPDRDHLHHILMRKGLTAHQALGVISALAIVMCGAGIAGEHLQIAEWVMFAGFIGLFLAYHYTLIHGLSNKSTGKQSGHSL